LLQLSYSELYFVPKLWPELSAEDWAAALREYAARQRRYGS
jgi:undecaprenyl diphosphate synthase